MRIVFMFLTFVVLLGACKGSQPADTTDVLVSVKGRTLNRSEVNKLIPRGISSADSLLLAENFTKKWVKDVLVYDVALYHFLTSVSPGASTGIFKNNPLIKPLSKINFFWFSS